MSEWNRSGRADESRWQDRDEGRQRRDDPRWNSGQGSREPRSFDGDRDQEWLEAQRYGGRNYAPYGGSGYARQGYGAERREYERNYDDERRGYGQDYGAQSYGDRSYGGRSDYARSDWNRGQGGFNSQNETLRRVTDGESDHAMRSNFGFDDRRGEHRGRGPRNYTRSDERIRDDVNDRLSDDSWLDASEIEVKAEKGEVTLTGTVNNRNDKRRAEDVAEQVSGVKHVQNNLRVKEQGSNLSAQSSPASRTGASTPSASTSSSTMAAQARNS
jgi:osmotically-inducible protein OsmY